MKVKDQLEDASFETVGSSTGKPNPPGIDKEGRVMVDTDFNTLVVYGADAGLSDNKFSIPLDIQSVIDATIAVSTPSGLMAPFAGLIAPSTWLLTNGYTIGNIGSGAQYESSTFEILFELLKTSWGNLGSEIWGTGGTVKLPDTRGRFIRSLDNGKGIDAGRVLGSTQSSQNLDHSHNKEVPSQVKI